MTPLVVPYHLDERLPAHAIPVAGETVTADLPPGGDVWHRMASVHSAVADRVSAAVRAGERPNLVSGDCLVALGVYHGVQRAGLSPAIVWFDAHGDVHTRQTSTSGYPGGMSLRLVLGAHPDLVVADPLPESAALLVDARDLDPAEVDYLASAEVRRARVDEFGPHLLPDAPVILHVDVDVIDSGELPGLKYPVPGGPSTADVVAAVHRGLADPRVVAVHIALPWHADPAEHDRRAALLTDLLGAS